VFAFLGAARLTGTIDGGGGVNTLDDSNYNQLVKVNLALGTATGTAGIANIQNVIGGQSGSLLVGNAGANVLRGGAGRNVIIGGSGADTLTAGKDGDLLIGGSTIYDLNAQALDAILAEWRRTDEDYPTRIANLRAGVGQGAYHLVLGDTVLDDTAADLLTGGAGMDWFWAMLPQDTVKGRGSGEQIN
jgi:Ca2+-binding RTX toxin-like protein